MPAGTRGAVTACDVMGCIFFDSAPTTRRSSDISEGEVMTIQCPQCAREIGRDAYDRLPPWCPSCGGDLKARRAAAPAAAAAAPAVAGDGASDAKAGLTAQP